MCHLSQEWTKLERPEGTPWPVERSSHAACCLNYGEEYPQLLVTGGVDKNATTLWDVWILDVNSGRWREVSGDECVTGSTDWVCSTDQVNAHLSCLCYIDIVTNKSSWSHVYANLQHDVRYCWSLPEASRQELMSTAMRFINSCLGNAALVQVA